MEPKHISYNGWNLVKCIDPNGDTYISAKCPHCEYSAPQYADTPDTMLFKYCPNCGEKLSEETVITDIDVKYGFDEEPEPVIRLTYDLKKELSKGIDNCYSSVSFRYVGSLNDERNRSEMCKIFSDYIKYFRQKNNLTNRLSDEVKAVPNSDNSVDIVFPGWVAFNINPKYSIQAG